jgi:hypothetical protein
MPPVLLVLVAIVLYSVAQNILNRKSDESRQPDE